MENTEIEAANITQAIYKNYQNDVSFMINGKLVILIEHQSTINFNMPLRFLLYVARIYEGLVPLKRKFQKQIYKIPTPEFYVLYNGNEPYNDETELKLSDAFFIKQDKPSLELNVKFLNIKNSKNEKLKVLKNCSILKEYSQFIELVREYAPNGEPEGFKQAIKFSLEKNILNDYLKKRGSEVLNMLMTEYNYEDDIAAQREEAFEEGIQQGQHKANIETAKNLFKENIPLETISKCVGLSVEELQEIIKK